MIKLSNGHTLEFVAASGALGFDGRGWPLPKYWFLRWMLPKVPNLLPIIKTITLERIEGNPWAIYDAEDFTVNAVQLWNHGVKEWIKKYLPRIKKPTILSITERSIGRINSLATEIAEAAKTNGNIIGIEFNASCPNDSKIWTPRDVQKACIKIKRRLNLPLGLKIGYHTPYLLIVKKTERLVEWLSFNSVPWELVFGSNRESPLFKKYGVSGAVSGEAIRRINKQMAIRIKKSNIKTPVVASSVGWGKNFEEGYQDFLDAFFWADAISFGSLFRKHPLWPIKMMRKYKEKKGGEK